MKHILLTSTALSPSDVILVTHADLPQVISGLTPGDYTVRATGAAILGAVTSDAVPLTITGLPTLIGVATTTVVNDLIDVYYQDNAADSLSVTSSMSAEHNGNTKIVASQSLYAENSNSYLDEVVDLDGEDGSETAVGYNSGSNSVNDNAFAAYAGILNQAWNTGINANTQAATNIAAQGTVNFGVSQSDGGE